MKKLIFLFTVLFMAFNLQAQYVYQFDQIYFNYNYLSKSDKQKIINNHVKEMTEVNSGKKEKTSKKYEFDSSGELSKLTIYHWSFGKLHKQYIYSSIHSKQMPDYIILNGKGEEILKEVYTYNNDTLLTEELEYKKGELFSKILYKYDSSRVTESEYYKKNMDKPMEKWIYEYYPNHSKKSSTLFKYGKIKYVWNYECKEEGELIKKHKDTTIVCEKTAFDKDSNKTVTSRQFNQRGKPYKNVYVYNKANKLIESRHYNHKDILRNSLVQNPDNSSNIWYYYDSHGKERLRHEKIYN